MKKSIIILAIILLSTSLSYSTNSPSGLYSLFMDIKQDVNAATVIYQVEQKAIYKRLTAINNSLSGEKLTTDLIVNLLLEKDRIHEELRASGIKYNFKLASIRFKKGIDLIKLLYEKILDLDHHFTALNTYQNINNISNPHSYPEFLKSKESLTKSIGTKNSIQIPKILESNIYVSLVTTVVSSFFGSSKKTNRAEDISNVSCILDFTTVMHSDLNIIYYETEFLKDNNESLKKEIYELFHQYTKVVNYSSSLENCRNSDDWDSLNENLGEFLVELEELLNSEPGSPQYRKAIKGVSNLEFSLDKVFGFLTKYSSFVDSGTKYYNKFYKIINNYKNASKCSSHLPVQYEELKSDIELSIQKFKVAYDIGELKGSGLRDLIYGVPDAY